MGFLDRLFGRQPEQRVPERDRLSRAQQPLTDEQAIARYRYMLQTAPPELIEQAHAEAFAQLTPDQRAMVLREISESLPERERELGGAYRDDPQSLARMATRAEMRRPGTLERTFGGMGFGMGGGMRGGFGGSFLSSLAGAFVGSMIAQQFFDGLDYDAGFADSQLDQQVDAGEPDLQDGDPGGFGDDLGGDFGGDFGDFDASI